MSLNDFNEYFDVELQSDDVDTIAGYYLTEVGRIPTLKERLSCEVDSQKKHLILTNDKVKTVVWPRWKLKFLKSSRKMKKLNQKKIKK